MAQKTEKKDFDLTSGPIAKKLLLVATPIMGMQLMQMLYNLADVFWMGRLSEEAVAATGAAGMFLWLSMGIMLLGRVGAEIGVSQNLGKGEKDTAQLYAQNALFIGGVLGLAVAFVMVAFSGPLIGFFNFQEQSVVDSARSYLMLVAIGCPFEFVFFVLAGTYNASGNTRTPFVAGTVGLVINMVLDPILIFGLNMGIFGAAISNVLGQILSCGIMLYAIKRSSQRPFKRFAFFAKPDWQRILRMLRWSVPTALESILFTVLTMFTARFTASFGADKVATSRVGSQFESLTWLLGGGFASALTAFMGQNFGAGKWTRIRQGYATAIRIMLVWGVITTLALAFGSRTFFGIFLPTSPTALALGIVYGRLLALCQIPQCMESISGSVFKGTGNTVQPFVVSASSNALRVILAFFLMRTSLGVYGVWLAISLGAALRGVWALIWCRRFLRDKPREDVAASL